MDEQRLDYEHYGAFVADTASLSPHLAVAERSGSADHERGFAAPSLENNRLEKLALPLVWLKQPPNALGLGHCIAAKAAEEREAFPLIEGVVWSVASFLLARVRRLVALARKEYLLPIALALVPKVSLDLEHRDEAEL